jgi:hypothetical protein
LLAVMTGHLSHLGHLRHISESLKWNPKGRSWDVEDGESRKGIMKSYTILLCRNERWSAMYHHVI